MGFFQQLKLLLWKNYTVKKRHPFVLLAELTIPLVIFFVLVGIRLREEPRRYSTYNTYKQPLPSAGLLPFLNKFCPGGERNRVSMFADLIRVLSSLHLNNTLLAENDEIALDNAPRGNTNDGLNGAETSDLGWVQDPVGDLELFNSNALWNVNVTFREVLLDDRIVAFNHFVEKQFGNYSQVADQLLSQEFTLAVLYDMYKAPDGTVGRSRQDLGFGAILATKMIPLLMKWGLDKQASKPPQELAENFLSAAEIISYTFARRAEPVDVRNKLRNPVASSQICSIVLSSFFTSLQSADDYKQLVKQLICDDDPNAESDLALIILSSINATKALESAYIKVGRDFSQSRFDLYSTFTSDLDDIYNLADYLLRHSSNSSLEDNDVNSEAEKQDERESNLLRFFLNIAPSICGKSDKKFLDEAFPKKVDRGLLFTSLKKLEMHYEMIKFSEAGIFLLRNNPHILFAPNTSEKVQAIVENANRSFAMVDTVTHYAQIWLETSQRLRKSVVQSKSFQTSYIFSESVKKRDQICDQLFFMTSITCLMRKSGLSGSRNSKDDDTSSSKSMPKWLEESKQKARNFFEVLEFKLDQIDEAANRWLSISSNVSLNIWKGFESERKAESWFKHEAYKQQVGVLAIVSFETDKNGDIGSNVKYKIRQNSTLIASPTHEELPNFWTPTIRADMAIARKYFINGFVIIQDIVERSIIEVVTNRTIKEPGLHLTTFPVPCNTRDHFLFTVSYVMPLCMTVAWAYSVAMLVQYIVYEKEQGLKEVTRLMGLSNAVHWVAWFISAFIQMQVIAVVTSLILKLGSVLPQSNFFLIWGFLSLYNIANIMFSFLVSVLYSKAKVAAACAGIIYFLTYVPYLYLSIMEDSHMLGRKVSPRSKYIASLCSTTAFGLGAKYFAVYEVQGTGVQLANLGYSPFQNDQFNLTDVVKMMIVDSILYALLAWYIEAVFPGKYGLPRPVYFPFMKSYWIPKRRKSWSIGSEASPEHDHCNGCTDESEEKLNDTRILEDEPVDLQLGVSIKNLSKSFKQNFKPAVDNLSLNLYQSQITALLGHNGAGKTTTMSILTGMIPASSGTASIYGNNIQDGMDLIRKSLGMCPQHNVLFESLTVEEHLWFYASLKGMSSNDIYYAVNTLLRDIGMELKRVDLVDSLSGGMKRKLSVAIAFIGNAKLVILDEPTAGVDPYARRAIWDLILKFKKGRTILLSTHFMDEADFLADRIAIMSTGKLRCCGSSMYLKCNYGSGYHLTLVKDKSKDTAKDGKDQTPIASQRHTSTATTSSNNTIDSVSMDSSVSALTWSGSISTFIGKYIEGVYLDWESSRELSFTLPYTQRQKFSILLEALQNTTSQLGITSFGVRDTSLEEVFIKAIFDSSVAIHPNKQERYKQIFNWFHRRTAKLTAPITSSGASPDTSKLEHGQLNGLATSKMNGNGGTGNSIPIVVTTPNERQGECMNGRAVPTDLDLTSSSHDSRLRTISLSTPIRELKRGNSFTDLCAQMKEYPVFSADVTTSKESCGIHPFVALWYLYLRQLKALLHKRFIFARRNPKAIFTQIFLPSLFVSIAMTVAFYRPTSGSDPPVVMSTSNYHRYTGWGQNIVPVFIRKVDENHPAPEARKILDSIIQPSGLGSNCLMTDSSETASFDQFLPPRFPLNSTFVNFIKSCWRVRRNEFRLNKGYVPMNIPQTFQISYPGNRNKLEEFIETALQEFKDTSDYKCKCWYEHTGVECNKEVIQGQKESESTAGFVSMTGDEIVFLSKKDENDFLLSTYQESQLNRFGGYSIGGTRHDVNIDFSLRSSERLRTLVKREELYVYYDLKPRQTIPTYINAINNAILRANIDPEIQGNPNTFGITLINHPLNNTRLMSLEYFETGTDVVIALFIIIAMSFVPASFVVFLVSERYSNAKHLQMVSGMSPLIFWISNYIWDMLNYLVPASACILILIWFDLDAYTSKENLPVVVFLFLLFGWSITPMMYPPSFLFSVPSTAYIVLIVGNLFFGVTAILSVFLLDRFVQEDELLLNVRYVLEYIFLLLPNYNLGRCLAKLAINDVQNKFNIQIGQSHRYISSFDWKVSGQALTAMAFEGMAFFILTILIQYRFFLRKKRLPVTSDPIENEDVDVAAERSRVLSEAYKSKNRQNDEIVFENLSKVYKKSKTNVLAVDRICLGVPQGECFGLLGVNGAGKTSTFKMLTGHASISAGDALIHQHSVVHDLKNVHSAIGYCPQFDALFGELTVIEHLELYAAIRGLSSTKKSEVLNWVLSTLNLRDHMSKQTRTLSGGNKRKLSAAIALLGNPKVVLLDEPTSGMDPIARRFLWDLIKSVVKSGHSVILTSHSMEECEALCTRLAIMVNGHFKCLGSCQHLVNRFGDGYTVNVKVTGFAKQLRNFLRYFCRQYPTAVIIDRHQNQIQYQVASDGLNLSKLFHFLELCVADAKVEEYSISQTTLERVFINFAREQADEDINILREPLCQHKRTLSGISDIGSLASEADNEQEFVSLSPTADFINNPNSPPPTQSFAPNSFLDDLHLDEVPIGMNYNNYGGQRSSTPVGAAEHCAASSKC